MLKSTVLSLQISAKKVKLGSYVCIFRGPGAHLVRGEVLIMVKISRSSFYVMNIFRLFRY